MLINTFEFDFTLKCFEEPVLLFFILFVIVLWAQIFHRLLIYIYTLKRISNWSLYKIWYYATYLINPSKVWTLCIVHTYLSINRKKVVVEFGRKVFLVDCLLWKNIKYGENQHNRTCSSVFMHTKIPSVTIHGWGVEMTSSDRFFYYMSVPISVWCWHGITHHVTWLETH